MLPGRRKLLDWFKVDPSCLKNIRAPHFSRQTSLLPSTNKRRRPRPGAQVGSHQRDIAHLMLRSGAMAHRLRLGTARPAALCSSTPALPRTTAAITRSYATELEPEHPRPPRQGNEAKLGRSFQGQVMGSIGSRLRREREQRVQYEKWRDMTDPSRNWMLTFRESCIHWSVHCSVIRGSREKEAFTSILRIEANL